MKVNRVLILGGGSAGFLVGLTLRARNPQLPVTVLRSKDIGVIGVGEGTTALVLQHLHGNLKIGLREFFRDAEPVPKLGLRSINWGPRQFYDYNFAHHYGIRYHAVPRETGFYAEEDLSDSSLFTALMSRNRCCLRGADGQPQVSPFWAYHLENKQFVALLERYARQAGVAILDDTVVHVIRNEAGIESLRLESGNAATADLFVDCSGFASMLLGGTLEEPFVSYARSLFCDRAVVGGWDRSAGEPIQPYTVAEGMNAGWCWRIDHEARINRGYVYSSAFVSDAEAEAEFRRKNPKVQATRLVMFRSGRYQRAWVKNVVAVGNAVGFVEPLEATAIGAICGMSQNLAEMLGVCGGEIEPSMVALFNRFTARQWDQIRDFLAVHYRFATRPDTPFWQECRKSVDVAGAQEVVDFYRENGPTSIWRNILTDVNDSFGAEGYLSILVGQKVPCKPYLPSSAEKAAWTQIKRGLAARAQQHGMTVPETIKALRATVDAPAGASTARPAAPAQN